MRFVATSDTHGTLGRMAVPDGDVFIHAGDATIRGSQKEFEQFNEDLGRLPHPIKIFIPGNHDKITERVPEEAVALLTNVTHYLVDQEVVLDGIKIYGSPWQPRFGFGFAWNADRGVEIKSKWDKIPEDTDILVTHGPPFGIGDEVGIAPWVDNVGCQDLLEAIQRIGCRYHISGHIHEGFGARKVGETTYINAAAVALSYNPVNPPYVFNMEKR